MARFSFKDATVLITGASSGIGMELARQIAPEARRLILVARRWERLETLREVLTTKHPGLVVEHYACDLAILQEIERFVEWLASQNIQVDCLINNAGLGDLGIFSNSDWKRVESMLLVNMLALTRLTHQLLPGMIARRHGAVLNVGSTAGFLPLPTFAVYAATKSFVNNFTEAIRLETLGRGVTVTVLCPVETEFGRVAERQSSRRRFRPPRFFYIPLERVAREAIQGLCRGQARVLPGKRLWLPMWAAEITPRFILRFVLGLRMRFDRHRP